MTDETVSPDKPLISIIMAAYNAENTIETSVRSVMAQSYVNWELLIINDCSKDNTASIASTLAASDARIRLLCNKTNCGVSITRKIGMDAACGTWIAILDSDDLWETDKLEKQLLLANNKGAELIFTGSKFINSDGKPIDWQLRVPETLSYRQLLKQNLVSNSSVLVKTELYKRHYAIGDKMHEDFAVWLGITKTGKKAFGIDEPLLIYRLSKKSKSSNKLEAAKMNWNTYRYIGLNPVTAVYYMCWYCVKNIIKYSHLM